MIESQILNTVFKTEKSKSLTSDLETIKTLLTEIQKLIGNVNDAAKGVVGAFRPIGKTVSDTEKSVSGMGKSVDDAGKSISNYEKVVERLSKKSSEHVKALNGMTGSLSANSEEHLKAERVIKKVDTSLHQARSAFEKYLDKVHGVRKGTSEYTAEMNKLSSRMALAGAATEAWHGQISGSALSVAQMAASSDTLSSKLKQFVVETEKSGQGFKSIQKGISETDSAFTNYAKVLKDAEKGLADTGKAADDFSKSGKKIKDSLSDSSKSMSEYEKVAGRLSKISGDHVSALDAMTGSLSKNSSEHANAEKVIMRVDSSLKRARLAFSEYLDKVHGVKKGTSEYTNEMNKLSDRMSLAEASVRTYYGQIKGGENSIAQMAASTETVKSKLGQFVSEMDKSARGFKSIGEGAANASRSFENYEKNLKDADRATKQASDSSSMFADVIKKLNEKMGQVAVYGVAATAVYALMNAMKEGIREIINFSQALSNLMAISGATNEDMLSTASTIKDVARDTKFSTREISDGMVLLVQSGLDAKEAILSIRAASELATGTLSSMENSTDLMTTTMRSFGLEATESGRIADVMANAINKSKLTVDKLRIAFNYVGVTAKQSGVSLEEVAATMSILANNGLRASTIGTGLRRVLAGMVSPSTKMATALEAQGIALDDLNPKVVGWETALGNLSKMLWDSEKNAVNMGKAFEFFGLRGQQTAAALVDSYVKGGGGWEKMLKGIREVGTASDMSGTQAEGLGVKFKNLSDRFQLVFVALGEAGLENILGNAVDFFRSLLTVIEKLTSTFGPLILEMTVFVGAVKAIHAVGASHIFKMMAERVNLYRMSVVSATKAQGVMAASSGFLVSGIKNIGLALKAFAISNPFTIAAAAAIALVQGMKYLAESSERAAKEAMKLSSEYERQAGILTSYNKILGESQNDYDTFSTAMKRFGKENRELAKELEKISGIENIVNVSPDEMDKLSGAFQKLIDAKLSESLENDRIVLEKLSNNFMSARSEMKRFDDQLDAGKISSSEFNSKTVDLRKTLSDFGQTSDSVVAALAKQASAHKMTTKEALTFIESMNVSQTVADEMKAAFVKSVNEIARVAKMKFSETKNAIASLPESYDAMYKNMDALRKVDFINFKDKLAREVTEFRKHAISMSIPEEDIQSGMAALRAKGHAEYKANLEKEAGLVKDVNTAKLEHIVEFAQQAREQYEKQEIDYETLQNRLVGYSDAANGAILAGAKATSEMHLILDKDLSNEMAAEYAKRMEAIEKIDGISVGKRKQLVMQTELEISRIRIDSIKETTGKTIAEYEAASKKEIDASDKSADKVADINLRLLKKKEEYYKKARESLESELEKSLAKEKSIADEIKAVNKSISEEKMSSDEYATELRLSLLSEEERYAKRVEEINKLLSKASETAQEDGRKAIDMYKEAKEKTKELQDEIQKGDEAFLTKDEGIKNKLALLEQADRGMADAAKKLQSELEGQAEQAGSNTEKIKNQLKEVGDEMDRISKGREISINLKMGNMEEIKKDFEKLADEVGESMKVDIDAEEADEKLSALNENADKLNEIIKFQNEYSLDTSEAEDMLQNLIKMADELNKKLERQVQLASARGSDEIMMATGGSVPGSGTGDTVPAMLTPKEFVQPVPAVNKYGDRFMEMIRRMVIPVENVKTLMAVGRRRLADAVGDARSSLVQSFSAGGPVRIPNIRPITHVANTFGSEIRHIQKLAEGGPVRQVRSTVPPNMGTFNIQMGGREIVREAVADAGQIGELMKMAWMREKKMRSNA